MLCSSIYIGICTQLGNCEVKRCICMMHILLESVHRDTPSLCTSTPCAHVTMCMCGRNPTSLLPNSHSSDPISGHILTSTSSSSHTSTLNSRQIAFKLKFFGNAFRFHVTSTIAMPCYCCNTLKASFSVSTFLLPDTIDG